MRLIVISLGMGLLLYGLAHNALPSPTLAIIGFLIITSGVVSRPLGRLGIPEASGAMLVGLVVGLSAVLSSQWASFLQPFSDVALTWLGLSIGSALTRRILTNKRLLLSAGVLYLTPLVVTYASLLVWGMPALPAGRLAILAGVSAPLFIFGRRNSPNESQPLSLLVTALGLLLWGLTGLPMGLPFAGQSLWTVIVDLMIFAVGIEMAFRIFQTTRTDGNRAVALSFFALLLTLVAWARGLYPLPLALLGGVALSLRSTKAITPVTSAPFSQLITAFALATFGLHLWSGGNSVISSMFWPPLLVYGIAGGVGKIAGGLIANRLLRLPSGSWLPLMPQGFLALVSFATLTETAAPDTARTTNLIFFAFFCLAWPMATTLLQWTIQKWKNGRRAAHATRQAV